MSTEGTVADYGILAKEDIEEGEVLFTIPRSALLHQETTKVSALLKKGKSSEKVLLKYQNYSIIVAP